MRAPRVFAAALVCAAALCAVNVFAETGTNANIIFPELANQAGARAQGIGGAFTAVCDDIDAAYWNPAGLTAIKAMYAAASYDALFVGSALSKLAAAVPVGPGTAAVSLFYMDFGAFEEVDGVGTQLGGVINPYTISGGLSYGMTVMEKLSAGMSAKFVLQSTGSEFNAGVLADAGALYDAGFLRAGIVMRNIGFTGGYSMPADIRMGVALIPADEEETRLIVSADAGYALNDNFDLSAGFEYFGMKTMYVRAGYKYRFGGNKLQELSGITAGAGLKLGIVGFDYAFVPFGELGTTHRLTLNLDFEVKKKREEILRRETLMLDSKKQDDQKPEMPEDDEEVLFKMFYDAGTAENSGNLKLAEQKYREMLKLKEDYAPALKRLGAVYFKQGRKKEAIKAFSDYLKLVPDDAAVKKWMEKNAK
ncbi:MAG TPA: PorV/PorQ family protein [Candidatus Goldiibacteriota bacterium]|nr:PorV/PorQ family protein [Candidatus Goldiibacteriota bacterium]